MKKVKKIRLLLCVLFIGVAAIIVRYSFSYKEFVAPNSILSSSEYEITSNTIYAVPTSMEFRVSELLTKLDYENPVEIYNTDNEKLKMNDAVGTGYTLKTSNKTYTIVVLGDVTGDGIIEIGDVSKSYNGFRGNKPIDELSKDAAMVTRSDDLLIGDVSKLYNFFRGNKPFTYFSYLNVDNGDQVEALVQEKVSAIRATDNTNISSRTGSIYYVSNDGDDNNNGLSESSPIKTLDKLQQMFSDELIPDHSTILFRDGDTFTGRVDVNANDILLGSYGDISLGKPVLTRSPFNGAKVGTWTEVKPNIWKFSNNDSDKVFGYDVGMVTMYCDSNNNNCSKSMTTLDRKFEFGQKITTNSSYDETDLDNVIDTLLTHDLEFYHGGHAYNNSTRGTALYLYSTVNPSERFDDIEFSLAGNLISTYVTKKTDLYVDNIKALHVGSSGVLSNTTANLVVTNCEFGFIGGSVHNYDGGTPTRYGNAITPVASIEVVGDYPVKEGFVVDNNYVYQCYDTGLSFQYTGKSDSSRKHAKVEKAVFTNNVLEYSNYNIEYWTSTDSSDEEDRANTYINKFDVTNNIMRKAGSGICETRPDKKQSAHIKTWNQKQPNYNIVKDRFLIHNNIFDGATEQYVYIRTGGEILPTFTSNVFIGDGSVPFGTYDITYIPKDSYPYESDLLDSEFPYNKFINTNEKTYNNDSGVSNQVSWVYDASAKTLSVNGEGAMADYTLENPAPWYQYRDAIKYLNIGSGITKLGNYSFYDLEKLLTINYSAIHVSDLADDNNVFTYVGKQAPRTELVIGGDVEYLPKQLTRPKVSFNDAHYINDVRFMGNKVQIIYENTLFGLQTEKVVLPEGITTLRGNAIANNSYLKVAVLPSTVNAIGDRAISLNSSLEKVIMGDTTNKINGYTFRSDKKISTIVMPEVGDPTYAVATTFEDNKTKPITIYGNESTQTWVNNVIEASGQTNIIYKPLSEYRSNITSNGDINGSVEYNGSYTFTTDKDVSIYTYFVDSEGRRVKVHDVNVNKDGNTYTINNIKLDTFIEIN